MIPAFLRGWASCYGVVVTGLQFIDLSRQGDPGFRDRYGGIASGSDRGTLGRRFEEGKEGGDSHQSSRGCVARAGGEGGSVHC